MRNHSTQSSLRRRPTPWSVVTLALVSVAAQAEGTRVVVPAFGVSGQAGSGTADVLTELLLNALLNRHGVRALGPGDLAELLSHEQQKQLLGCADDSCMAQVGGALGARNLIAGQLGKLGTLHVLSLKLIDVQEAKVVNRVSLKLKALEEAADALGPLVDKLLGSAPKAASNVPAFAPEAPAEKPVAQDPRAYCRAVGKYRERLAQPPYAVTFVTQRQALLEDLLRTEFQRDFDEKRGCLWSRDGWITGELRRQILRAAAAGAARDARQRLAEWIEMSRNLKVLEEAWTTGLEKEKHGAGRRPAALPFAVRAGWVSEPEAGAELERFKQAYAAAQQIVTRALQAVTADKLARLQARYIPRDPERGRTSPENVLAKHRRMIESGTRYDACPLFILSGRQIQERARRLADKGELQGCVRRIKDDFVGTDKVWLKKHQGKWRIDRW